MARKSDLAAGGFFLTLGAIWFLLSWKIVKSAAGPNDDYPLEAILELMPGMASIALGCVLIVRRKRV